MHTAGELDAFSIPEFCLRNSISSALFFKLIREGRGPRVMRVGRRTLITKESAAVWRSTLEAASGPAISEVADG
jgi:hypothetical protein